MQDNYDNNNVYARNIKDDIIHVSIAESGKKGYYCLGCGKEMQAVKSKFANRISYFRHDPKAVKGIRKCTYSDETHRHKIAKEILLHLKHIKVPAVYKYPPKGNDGPASFVKNGSLVEANSVGIEITFYEDAQCNIGWGSNPSIKDRFLIIKPDVTFFDSDGKPILFIELVATHKVNAEKKVKLRRLGVDTIQVKIPKDSPESIQESFYSTENTKWIYSYDEECAEYVPISSRNTEGVSSIDEDQRILFEESFKCRQVQINNLIRNIKRCLESKQYGDIEKGLRSELSRVKDSSKELESQLEGLREEHRNSVFERFKTQMEEFEREREIIEREEEGFSAYFKDLDKRYKSKKSLLEREEKKIDRELSGEIDDETGNGDTIVSRRREFERNKEDLQYLIREEEVEITRIEEEENTLPEKYRKLGESIEERFRLLKEIESGEIERLDKEEKGLQGKLDEEEEKLRGEFETEEGRVEKEFEALRKQSAEAVRRRSLQGNGELSTRIRRLLEAGEQLKDIVQVTRNSRRNRKAWSSFRSGAYQYWNE